MKASQIFEKIKELEERELNLEAALSEISEGYSEEVLRNALDKVRDELSRIVNTEYDVMPDIIKISATPNNIILEVGEESQLNITGYLSNGTTKDVSKKWSYTVHFRDLDLFFDNQGLILNAYADDFFLEEDTEVTLKKATNGWTALDNHGTRGLQVSHKGDNLFELLDFRGNPTGLEFKTDGNEEVGDNWVLSVIATETGTKYDYDDIFHDVFTVDDNGKITAVGAGEATLRVTNGLTNDDFVTITVTETEGE